jgi:hypothetical protein
MHSIFDDRNGPSERRWRACWLATLVVVASTAGLVGLVDTGTAAPDGTFAVRSDGDCVTVDALGDGTTSVADYYDYRTPANVTGGSETENGVYSSYGTRDVQLDAAAQLYVYHGTDGYSLVLLNDDRDPTEDPADASYAAGYRLSGLPAAAFEDATTLTDAYGPVRVAVEDDRYRIDATGATRDDEFSYDPASGSVSADLEWVASRTDGFAVRGLGSDDYDRIEVRADFDVGADRRAPDGLFVRDGAGDVVELPATEPVTVERGSCAATSDRTVRIEGAGSYVSYELVTDGGFARTDTLQSGDTISDDDTTATGGVVGFRDEYTFTGDITSISLSGPAEVFIDGEQVDPADFGANTIEFVGDGDRSTYEFSVSETVTDGTGLSGPDAFDGNAGSGAVYGGTDRYTFTGDLASLSVTGGATVLVDGEAVDPADFGAENTVRIEGNGTSAAYRLVVSDEVTGGDKLQSTDEFDGRLAAGVVAGGADEYTFTGDLQALDVPAGVTVYVNGEAVDPDGYQAIHEFAVVGDGTRSTYEVTVPGEFVAGDGLGGPDTFSGDTASGAVYGGTDSYVYIGDATPTALTVDGTATVLVDGEAVT